MKSLTKTQTIYIYNDLKAKGMSKGFRNELLDHICCLVEVNMSEGHGFSHAYQLSLEVFGNQGFEELKNISPKTKEYMIKKYFASSIAACILLMVLSVDARDIPSIHPISPTTKITSPFGERYHPIKKEKLFHAGTDFRAKMGTKVKATADGIITMTKEAENGYGMQIQITHDNNFITSYSALSKFLVAEGDSVSKGQIIALSGNTGASTAPHLHYEVIKDGEQVDPEYYMTKKTN